MSLCQFSRLAKTVRKHGLIQRKDWHHNQSFFMQLNEPVKEILRSLSWRARTYTRFWFSRHEYKKFWLTERTLRTIINQLKALGYIQQVWQEKYTEMWQPRRRNIFVATQKLFDMVASFTESINEMNEKIVSWCKEQNPVQTLKDFWIEVFNGGRIWKKKSSITVNKQNGAIKDWKTWKTYNLYNYLRESLDCTHQYFFKHFIG